MSINTTEENGKLIIFLQGRIDTQNAPQVEKELKEILNANEGRNFELDAEELEYISSAGLRILMKLRQMKKDSYPIRNVSSGVYDILEMTGFIELFDVQKALRKISIEGLEEIGRGATAKVYRLDRETVLKVYRPDTDLNIIHNENERTKNAFVNGIPTAIAFDIVKVGDCYGNVYELLDAEDFLTVLLRDKEHLEEHIRRFANDMRSMHQIEVNPFKFPPTKTGSIQALSFLEGICTKEERRKLKSLYENIPSRNTFIHGDCHPGNVMVQNGDLVFIDLMSCGCGHPIFDFASMCSVYHIPRSEEELKNSPLTCDFTKEERDLIWNTYLKAYLETGDEDFIRKVERQIVAVASARMLFAAVFIPGLIPPERVEQLKKNAISYVDEGLEPLVF